MRTMMHWEVKSLHPNTVCSTIAMRYNFVCKSRGDTPMIFAASCMTDNKRIFLRMELLLTTIINESMTKVVAQKM